MDRRDFFRNAATAATILGAGGLAGCGRPSAGRAGAPPPAAGEPVANADAGAAPAGGSSGKAGDSRIFEAPPGDCHVAIASNKKPGELVKAAVDAFGGPDAIFKSGDRVVIKPNLAWGREPGVGANTNPDVLKAVIQLARDAGAGEVLVVEHSCDKSAISFELSGAQALCASMNVPLISLDNQSMYIEKQIPAGVTIKSDLLARDILECDVYINLPCLKHHGATTASIAMKNQMGCNWDRQRYHRDGGQGKNNLHQNIADLATALRPTLVIVDATRPLKTNGPKGPGEIADANSIIVSHDMVAADALGTEMLGFSIDQVPHIGMAASAGAGTADIASIKIARV